MTRVDVRVGALRQVVPESLDFYFEIVSRDTACEGAALELELVGAWMRCATCGHEWDPGPRAASARHTASPALGRCQQFRCPACERAGAEVVRGAELEVESIEVETVEEEQCTAPR